MVACVERTMREREQKHERKFWVALDLGGGTNLNGGVQIESNLRATGLGNARFERGYERDLAVWRMFGCDLDQVGACMRSGSIPHFSLG